MHKKNTSKTLSMAIAALLSLSTFTTRPLLAKPAAKQTLEEKRLEEAKKHFKQAKEFYSKGEFIKAAAAFMIAYSKSNEPATLFNAARAYQHAGMFEQAIPLFEEYLTRSDATEDGKKDARKYIEDMKAELEKRKNPPPPDPPKVTLPLAPTPTTPEPPPPAPTKILPWVLIGAGSLVALGSTVGLLSAESEFQAINGSELDWAAPDVEKIYAERAASASQMRLFSGIGLGVGIATAGIGVWQLFTSTPPAPTTPAVRPVVLNRGGGITIAWQFQ